MLTMILDSFLILHKWCCLSTGESIKEVYSCWRFLVRVFVCVGWGVVWGLFKSVMNYSLKQFQPSAFLLVSLSPEHYCRMITTSYTSVVRDKLSVLCGLKPPRTISLILFENLLLDFFCMFVLVFFVLFCFFVQVGCATLDRWLWTAWSRQE